MNATPPVDPRARRRSRLGLLLIVAIFAAPMLVAGALVLSGWQPVGKSHGQPIVPQQNLLSEGVAVTLGNGQPYAWRDEQPRMTLVALAGPRCATQCVHTLTAMAAARITLNQRAPRLRLLYLGSPPDAGQAPGMRRYWLRGCDGADRLRAFRPSAPDQVSALLVESNGTALSYYPAGFDPTGLREDLQKVIK